MARSVSSPTSPCEDVMKMSLDAMQLCDREGSTVHCPAKSFLSLIWCVCVCLRKERFRFSPVAMIGFLYFCFC